MTRDRTPAQLYALLFGLVLLAVGILGFIADSSFGTGSNVDGSDFIIFEVNGWHNIVHIAVWLILIGASMPQDAAINSGVLIGGGLVYILAAFLGFINHLQILSINNTLAPDNFLHLVSGVLAVTVGLLGARDPVLERGTTEADTLAGPAPEQPVTPRPPLTRG